MMYVLKIFFIKMTICIEEVSDLERSSLGLRALL